MPPNDSPSMMPHPDQVHPDQHAWKILGIVIVIVIIIGVAVEGYLYWKQHEAILEAQKLGNALDALPPNPAAANLTPQSKSALLTNLGTARVKTVKK